ncbi:hypothetical protein Tco_0141964, partial [Tanacetum coccineum]
TAEEGQLEDSTAGITVSTAPINISTDRETRSTAGRVVYGRRKEAIRLQKQVDEEEKAQISRDEEIARQLLALDEERVTTETKTSKDIDWNDPSVQKYWDLKNKPKSEAQARRISIITLCLWIWKLKRKRRSLLSFKKLKKNKLRKIHLRRLQERGRNIFLEEEQEVLLRNKR